MADKPELYYVVGPSGAGKTTLTGNLPREHHVNHDDLMRQFNNGSSENITAAVRAKADAEENRFWNEHLQNKESFSTEKTLKFASVLEWIDEAKQAGFNTHVAFIAAGNAETHVSRVQDRISQGGHAVAPKEVRDIHKASMSNLVLLAEAAGNGTIDRLTIYDNEQHTGLAVVDIEQGRVRIERDAPQWLADALAQTPFKLENLQLAERNRLTLSDLDRGIAIRTSALAKDITLPAAFDYDDTAEWLGEAAIREDLDAVRASLLRGGDAGTLVRDIAFQHGYTSQMREYADTLVLAVETQLAPELKALEELSNNPINPTLERRGPFLFWQEKQADLLTKYATGTLMVPGTYTEKRDVAAQRAVSQGMGDHAGHLIGHQFGGPEIPANLTLQHYGQNQGGGTYWSREKAWADALRAGTAVDVTIRETTRDGDAHFYKRVVDWTETTPDGKQSTHNAIFSNVLSERARAAQGIVTVPPVTTSVQELYPNGPPPVYVEPIAVALTSSQVRQLLEAEYPGDRDKAKQAYSAIFHGDGEPVAVMDDRVELDYSQDAGSFFAVIDPAEKEALDTHLSELPELKRQAPQPSKEIEHER